MGNKIIGRLLEQAILKNCYESENAEFIAVYGRRRVGKTYLVKNFFNESFDFYITGIYQGSKKEQLIFFNKQLNAFSNALYPIVDNWFDAFDQLKHYISALTKEKIVIFIDELPWLDTPRSRFLKAFELFWNSWGADQRNLKLVVCGSATTWMVSHLLGNKGGLHNRVTRRLKLSPFSLVEVEQFLISRGIEWNRHQISEAYMIFGGTPYYLEMLQKGLSLAQNVDYLFFNENAELRDEYSFLFRSLFNNSSIYRSIVELLSKKASGLTRAQMAKTMKIPTGGMLSEVLENLCNCDFIRKYSAFGKKERDVIYQLTDLFTLFYLRFVKNNNGQDSHFWSNMIDAPERRTWCGYAYEQLCLHHIPQIKKQLGINGIQSDVCAWSVQSTNDHKGAQIDLIIDRKDQIINLCEMKYSVNEYEITQKYLSEMQSRKELFRSITKTRKALHLTMVTTYGIKHNAHSGMIQSEVTLDNLFQ